MDATAIALRLIGAFYVFAGYVATRAALSSHILDKALAAIGGKGLSRVEWAITAWHTSAATLVLAGGLCLLLLIDIAVWLFVASALGQAAYIFVVAPCWFDLEDPPDPKGRQQTTNAFVIYCAATTFVVWAASRGRLVPWLEVDWPWLTAAGVVLAASIVHILRIVAGSTSRAGSIGEAGSLGGDADAQAKGLESEVRRVKVMAARECHPLWSLDDALVGDFGPYDLGLGDELAWDLIAWNDSYGAMLVAAEVGGRVVSEAQLSAHAAEGRRLAVRLARERPDLSVYVEDTEGGVVQVHAVE